MSSCQIKTIFFDAVGTLFDVKGSVGQVYLSYAKNYGVSDSPEMVHAVNEAFKETIKGMPPPIFAVDRPEQLKQCERLWWFDVVHGVFYRVGMFEQFDDFFDEVYQAFGEARHWELYPETISVLTQLKQRGFELGMVTNFDSRLYQVARELGLDHYFDSVTISSLAGMVKPAPGIFSFALDQHMVLPQEALHVGDHEVEDFQGAQQAGLYALLIDRSAKKTRGDHCLSNLSEMLDIPLCNP